MSIAGCGTKNFDHQPLSDLFGGKRMNILMLTQWFEPEPVFKGLSFAKALTQKGHKVQVLTGFPNYPEGRLYPGYRLKPYAVEQMDGITVIRAPLYPSHDHSVLRRAANYLSFAATAALTGKSLLQSPDVLYAYHPPATVGMAALALKKRFGVPLVYDIQDMWPDSLAATDMLSNATVLRLINKCCRVVYAAADRIVVLSPGFKKLLIDRGVAPKKIHVIYNWCEEALLAPGPSNLELKRELGMAGRFNLLFAGNIGAAQGLDAVLLAAKRLKEEAPEVQFVFVGGGMSVTRLKRRAVDLGLNNVRFLARRPMKEIAAILNLSDILLVHLRKDSLFEITIPSKTQAYLSVGKPILMGVGGDAARLVRQAGAGLTCEPENPDRIADAVTQFYTMPADQRRRMGERGRAFYRREMSLAAGMTRFEALFKSLNGPGRLTDVGKTFGSSHLCRIDYSKPV